MTLRRTRQGGSVASYIIVGVILTIALIGSVYLLNRRSQQVRKDQQIAADNKQKTNTDNTEKAKTKEVVVKQPAVENTSVETNNTDSNSNTSSTDNTSALPQTGPDYDVISYIGIYSLTAALCGYYVSARRLKNSL